jgi:Na+-translocating ferredoxin:NAD+ oxidoreductase RnfE subunit
MSKREILGYIIFFKGIGIIGLMVLLLGINVLHFLYPVYWAILAIGAVIMLSGLGLAAASEKWED